MRITIIGSFRRYYDGICGLIELFEREEIEVLSPRKSFIIGEKDGFVILDSDRKDVLPAVIQEHVFDNIKRSDYVYVWNPNGYLGNSTCYEIGKILEMKREIFFKERPSDLPIEIEKSLIKEPDEFIGFIHSKRH